MTSWSASALDDTVLAAMEQQVKAAIGVIADELKLDAKIEDIWNSPAVRFNEDCVAAVRHAAAEFGYSHRDIVSGAGHDAAYIARVAPTAMIFVPCEKGISHSESEKIEPKDATAGANVLLRAVLAYDRQQVEQAKR